MSESSATGSLPVDNKQSEANKKRSRDSPQKASNIKKRAKKTAKRLTEGKPKGSSSLNNLLFNSSSDSEETEDIDTTQAMAAPILDPKTFAAILRDAGVREALGEIFTPMVEEAVTKSNSGLSSRVEKIEISSTAQGSEIDNLKARLDNIEQQSRSCNLIVSGLPEKQGETLKTAFTAFSKDYLLTTLEENDIVAIFRLGKPVPDQKSPRPVLIKFKDPSTKLEVFKARVQLRKMDIGRGQPHLKPIFVNEDLAPGRAALFKECRAAVQKKILFNTWTFNGAIWAKRERDGNSFKIDKRADIPSLATTTAADATRD